MHMTTLPVVPGKSSMLLRATLQGSFQRRMTLRPLCLSDESINQTDS